SGTGPAYYPASGIRQDCSRATFTGYALKDLAAWGPFSLRRHPSGYSSLSSHLPDSIGNNYFTTGNVPRQTIPPLGHAKRFLYTLPHQRRIGQEGQQQNGNKHHHAEKLDEQQAAVGASHQGLNHA